MNISVEMKNELTFSFFIRRTRCIKESVSVSVSSSSRTGLTSVPDIDLMAGDEQPVDSFLLATLPRRCFMFDFMISWLPVSMVPPPPELQSSVFLEFRVRTIRRTGNGVWGR